jgi:hypothetical protein
LTFDQLIGGLYSAISADQLPGVSERPGFAKRIREALPHDELFTDQVQVSTLVGRIG